MSDYLWDKTGEADPEVARLEELLGELRYRPQKFDLLLELPAADARARRTILSWPALAAAAALAMMVLAGLWLAVVRRDHQRPSQIVEAPAHQSAPPEKDEAPAVAGLGNGEVEVAGTIRKRRPRARAPRPARSHDVPREAPDLVGSEQVAVANSPQVEEAKKQLMLALQLTSAELSFVQRKTSEVTIVAPSHEDQDK